MCKCLEKVCAVHLLWKICHSKTKWFTEGLGKCRGVPQVYEHVVTCFQAGAFDFSCRVSCPFLRRMCSAWTILRPGWCLPASKSHHFRARGGLKKKVGQNGQLWAVVFQSSTAPRNNLVDMCNCSMRPGQCLPGTKSSAVQTDGLDDRHVGKLRCS